MRSSGVLILLLLTGTVGAIPARAALPPPANREVDYRRDIQPVLAKRCFGCHGPKKQESEFRLDRRESLLAGGDFGEPAVVPGKSDQSNVVLFAGDPDADVLMPPEGERLSDAEVSILRAWIDQGAKMPEPAAGPIGPNEAPRPEAQPGSDHWSLQPIAEAAPPSLDDPWIAAPVDAFILRKLREKGLEPSPPADRVSLIRRLYLDVHGLPPSPEEIDRFVADESPDAYERLVDQVLASPRYGERWARHWLDVVRFAETDGFEMNQERPSAYRYRDYVIRSLNEDKPYDEFLFEQLAGDTRGEDAATGFLVGGPYDKVKSPDPLLTKTQRQDELADIINTTGTAMLGLTLGCARCHSHKFDPVPQTDYYSLQAVFAGVLHGERPLSTANRKDREHEIARLDEQLAAAEGQLAELETKAGINGPAAVLPPVNPRHNVERFTPVSARLVRFTIAATNNGSQPCIDELEVFTAPDQSAGAEPRNVALASAGAKATSSGDFPGNPKHKLAHLNDGRYGNARSWISNEAGRGWVQIELAEPAVVDRIEWARDREGQYDDRLAVDYTIEVALEPDAWQTVAGSEGRLPFGTSEAEVHQKRLAKLPDDEAKQGRELLAKLDELRKKRSELAKPPMVYAGRFEQPGPTPRLFRGDVTQPRELVAPDALSALAPQLGSLDLPKDAPEQDRRVALARWVTDPENPLTPRVIVNRVWQHHFGRGIVATPSDFGHMGEAPTHAELLDWLARQLVDGGWSLKHVHRLILLSSTYRQSSAPNSAALAVDADTRFLWRFPPRRLEAEAVRDSILATSGVLDLTMYGPGYSPFEPNQNYVRVYEPKEQWGPAEWRRMVYMTKVRMEHDGVFGPLDCPDAGQPTARRSRSTTPLQALNLLNSSFMVQQAELFADRVRREAGKADADQVDRAFRLAFGRGPQSGEREAAVALVDQHGLAALCRALFNANEFLFMP